MNTLLIFGLGYSGRAVARAATDFAVMATSRSPDNSGQHGSAGEAREAPSRPIGTSPATRPERAVTNTGEDAGLAPSDITRIPFHAAEPAILTATHILVTAPPAADGDPVLKHYAEAIAGAPVLRWIGYLSSTVVYGDRGGAWVDEDTPPAPTQPRGQRRRDAERAWSRFASRYAVDVFRLAGIYGPGRSAFDDLRAGTARRVVKPGHQFGRIHRDDIGRAVAAAMRQPLSPGSRVLNLADDVPSESAAVVTEAARLMGIAPPPEIAFADVLPAMSPMARGFWAESRKVDSRETQRALGMRWLYPSFREGLAAIWREESGEHSP